MTIMSLEDLFSDKQEITTTAKSTNIIDLQKGGNPSAPNAPIELLAQVVEDFAGATDLTLRIITDDNRDMTSPEVLSTSKTYPVADLVEGKRLNIAYFPLETQQFIALEYAVTGTATSGRITAGFALQTQTNKIRSI